MSEKKYQLFQQKEQISKKYTILAPESPDKNDRYQYVSRSIPETPEKLMGAIAAVEPGKRVVEIFGDKNCKIKHYVDFEAEFDSYDKVINNYTMSCSKTQPPDFPPEGFQTFCIKFFAFSRHFGSI